jgi:hypothetical protein
MDGKSPAKVLAEYREQLRSHVDGPGPVIQGFWVQGKPLAMLSSLEELADAETLAAGFLSVFNDVLVEAGAEVEFLSAAAEVNRRLMQDDPEETVTDNVLRFPSPR